MINRELFPLSDDYNNSLQHNLLLIIIYDLIGVFWLPLSYDDVLSMRLQIEEGFQLLRYFGHYRLWRAGKLLFSFYVSSPSTRHSTELKKEEVEEEDCGEWCIY